MKHVMNNTQVIEKFVEIVVKAYAWDWKKDNTDLNQLRSYNSNLFVYDGKLFNYGTCLVEYNGRFIVNRTKYSRTTSKIQSQIISELLRRGYAIESVYDMPRGVQSMIAYKEARTREYEIALDALRAEALRLIGYNAKLSEYVNEVWRESRENVQTILAATKKLQRVKTPVCKPYRDAYMQKREFAIYEKI